MADLQAGADLDRAVAEAIGCPLEQGFDLFYCENCDWYKVDRHTFCGCGDPRKLVDGGFRPSRDLNAAFAAASKAGLFDRYGSEGCLSQNTMRPVPKWMVCSEDIVGGRKGVIVYGSTPALAICAAILKLAERRPLPYA